MPSSAYLPFVFGHIVRPSDPRILAGPPVGPAPVSGPRSQAAAPAPGRMPLRWLRAALASSPS